MDDTPDHVKQKQLEIWLAKPVEERVYLTLKMNDDLFTFRNEVKKNEKEKSGRDGVTNNKSI